MSDSVRPHGLQPTRLPGPWDSTGKNTGVGCHFLLQCMKVKSESEVTQPCPTRSDLVTYNSLRLHGLYVAFQASLPKELTRQERWNGVTFPSPGDLPDPGVKPASPALAGGFNTSSATREACCPVLGRNKFCPLPLLFFLKFGYKVMLKITCCKDFLQSKYQKRTFSLLTGLLPPWSG